MAEAKNIRLYTPEGVRIEDPALAEDYVNAEKAGPFRVGQRALFYRDGGLKRYCIPLGQIDHAFTRVVACSTHCCCGKMDLNTFRLVVCGEGRELAAVYTETESYVDQAPGAFEAAHPGPEAGLYRPGAVN